MLFFNVSTYILIMPSNIATIQKVSDILYNFYTTLALPFIEFQGVFAANFVWFSFTYRWSLYLRLVI